MLPLLFLVATHQTPTIDRDNYGVPHIHAKSLDDAFFQAGYAVAQDRLWQMETSRRLAEGRLAELLGKGFASSDREVVRLGYTDEELMQQFDRLSAKSKAIIEAYAKGVNAYSQSLSLDQLPEQFRRIGFKPAPWTPLDSVAICVHLLQLFGHEGGGQIRNMAALSYLRGQKAIGPKALDVFDDLLWFNDPEAVTTVRPADDPLAHSHPAFYLPDRKTTEAHLAMLPKLGILEMLPALRLSSREESTRVAQNLSVPFHEGSYCVVVSPGKSGTGHPILLSGPQMGLESPSIVHEMSIQAPGLAVVGMDVPGVPGVIIGHTNAIAWGLTSGVADTDDIFFFPSDGTTYRAGAQSLPIQKIHRVIKVANGTDVPVEQMRTSDGPVVLTAGKCVFSRKSSYWMHEMESFDAWVDLWSDTTADAIDRTISRGTMNFNFFYATSQGDIGWRFVGLVPKRAAGVDPRFPTPGDPKFAWQGFLSPAEMPHVRNPGAGFLANWNNKPASWWPNADTPVWGKAFRNSALLSTLQQPKLMPQDLELSAWTIARKSVDWPYFKPYVEQAKGAPGYDLLQGYDGLLLDGSRQASGFDTFFEALRHEIFLKTTGSIMSPEFFDMVLQPSLMLRALERKTKFDYLGRSTPRDAVVTALKKLNANPPPPFQADTFPSGGSDPIPYSNRGSYIQIIEFLTNGIYGRNIVTPGVAESGPHATDQAPLARAWMYKPMRF